MSAKAILVFCAQALLVKAALSQCIGAGFSGPYGLAAPGLAIDGYAGWGARGLAYDGLAAPLGYDGLGWAGRGLAYDGLAAPLGYDGLGWAGRGLAYDGIYSAAPGIDFTPTSGGALPVTSGSAIAPVGLRVLSENAYEGILDVVGELPFVGTVGFESLDLPTVGAGAVNHACGNGVNAMISDDALFAPEYYGAYAPGLGCRAAYAGRRIAL